MADTRAGWGFDAHRFAAHGTTVLCGVAVDHDRGIDSTSDGDVAVHALIDALLGAAGMGDIGSHFPSDDPAMQGADSMQLLRQVVELLGAAGYSVGNADVTIISQSVRISPHREQMRAAVAVALGVDVDAVSVKGTTTDGLGDLGSDEGLAAAAIASIYPSA